MRCDCLFIPHSMSRILMYCNRPFPVHGALSCLCCSCPYQHCPMGSIGILLCWLCPFCPCCHIRHCSCHVHSIQRSCPCPCSCRTYLLPHPPLLALPLLSG